MQFYLNQATNLFVRGLGLNAVLSAATFKARDTVVLDVWFHDENAAGVALEDGTLLVFIVKDGLETGDTTLAFADEWTAVDEENKPGLYRALVSFNTENVINAIEGHEKIAAYGELSWSTDDGDTWESSNTLSVTIQNDVYKGTEGTPLEEDSPEEWLAARAMPFPLLRSVAAGHPAGPKQQVALTFTGTATDDGTVGIVLQGALLDATVNEDVGIILGNTADEMADAAAAALEANADVIAAGYDVTRVGNQVFVTAPEFAAEDGTLYLSMSPGTTGVEEAEFSEVTTGALPATATAIGQDCRYGDESPYRWFKAESITPSTVWFEITPGVIENRDTSTPERLFVQDSTLQTELLS